MKKKFKFTDKALQAIKHGPVPPARFELMDTETPCLGLRVSDKGHLTFILRKRFPGAVHPTRRALGEYGELTLAGARDKARMWLAQIRDGVDPAEDTRRKASEKAELAGTSFAAVCEDFFKKKTAFEREGRRSERTIRNAFLTTSWAERPISTITDDDIFAVINDVKDRGKLSMARIVLSHANRLFGWAIDARKYSIKVNPCSTLRAKALFGTKIQRDRVMTDDEVRAFWRATEKMPYPSGPAFRLLLLSGLRLNEAARAAWPEFDLQAGLWTIPSSRMKGKNGQARPHDVPITVDLAELLGELPRFKKGQHLFSTDFGVTAARLGSHAKDRLDQAMLEELQAMARERGDDPATVMLTPFVVHDVRRTFRTGMSRLRVPSDVAEALLAHVPSGIVGTYDRYRFEDEKKLALEKWARHLRDLAEPAPANVVALIASAASR